MDVEYLTTSSLVGTLALSPKTHTSTYFTQILPHLISNTELVIILVETDGLFGILSGFRTDLCRSKTSNGFILVQNLECISFCLENDTCRESAEEEESVSDDHEHSRLRNLLHHDQVVHFIIADSTTRRTDRCGFSQIVSKGLSLHDQRLVRHC